MSYSPDPNAQPLGTLFTRQLSQRDLSLPIPVNFVEQAGVSLRAACFADNQYLSAPAQRCFSNLLSIGFHRYEIDVYWDASRQLWNLCPVQLGEVEGSEPDGPSLPSALTATTEQQTDLSMTALSSLGNAERSAGDDYLSKRQATATHSALTGVDLPQATSTSVSVDPDETTAALSSLTSVALSASSTSVTSLPVSGDYKQVGPYACSESLNLNWVDRVMWTYLDTTETNLNATLRSIILNVHAAASASDPTGSAEAPSTDNLPNEGNLLSTVLAFNLSSFLYTPADLRQQRANINQSWYDVPRGMPPAQGYYEVNGPRDATFTPDGWPTENYVEMVEGKRLFLGFGSIDPQMQGYDVSRDDDAIFPQGYLQSILDVSTDASGELTTGCFYSPSVYATSDTNNSWAYSADSVLTSSTSSNNLTGCGISPILNVTLQDTTADQDFLPYQTYLQSTNWAWAPDYPRLDDDSTNNLSDNDNNNEDDSFGELGSQARCAALNASSGRWQNIVCDTTHHSACRNQNGIYDWSISPNDDATYTNAGEACPGDTAFDVPRTGLQNTYLVNTWRTYRNDPSNPVQDEMLWLNFNNLDAELCWVVGQNSTCPYVNRRSDDRQVVVPVVAAVIVFALGVLTVFVKCAANRQMNKRQKKRRRGGDGWDYEGVPS